MEQNDSLEQTQEVEELEVQDTTEEKEKSKSERIESEKKEVISRVNSGNIEKVRDRVAFILNYSNEARNSDIDLAWLYWRTFEADKFNGTSITKEQLRSLAKIGTLSRHRAKIQNEYKLFEADYDVKQYRGVLQENNKQEAVDDKPKGIGMYSVYIDETGKNQSYLSVGSLWILEVGSLLAYPELAKWKNDKQINYEFHFNALDRFRMPMFKEFFSKFLSLHPAISFKLIVVNNKGFSDKNAAITDLTYHLLNKGVGHENDSGRAPLPRVLQVWIDEDEKGSDILKIENIKERIDSQRIEGLHLGEFQAVDSESNFYIQIVDLFTGAINRKLNTPPGSNHFKDNFADFILETIGFDISDIDTDNDEIDHSKLFNLT
ncbi:DUF3800 domain-containing protein [Pontibacter sp. FD36]|uniref:DUF3800 domain-containing protein n=1 Tax=Pontibacter sp. FD36 TaxID=2789860 RepID=UPI0018AB330F|nr:DUF3800 domain-containing protein [Pontibacter sp. FD36]MBF8964301.1 DUF3800 domain-containing protein [Pontibacter sp. FD36]